MRFRSTSIGVLCVIALIALIAFTSTSIAGEISDRAFHSVVTLLFGPVRGRGHSFGLLHFAAEKGVHFVLFLALAILLLNILPDARWRTPVILAIALSAGASSEWLQSFFPGRDPTLRDVAIDFCGAAFGLVLNKILYRRGSQVDRPAGGTEI